MAAGSCPNKGAASSNRQQEEVVVRGKAARVYAKCADDLGQGFQFVNNHCPN